MRTLRPTIATAWMAAVVGALGCAGPTMPAITDSRPVTHDFGSPALPSDAITVFRDASEPFSAPWQSRNDTRAGKRGPASGFSYSAVHLVDTQRSHHGRPHNYLRFRRESVDTAFRRR